MSINYFIFLVGKYISFGLSNEIAFLFSMCIDVLEIVFEAVPGALCVLSPVASAVFWISISEAVLNVSASDYLAWSKII